MLILDLNTEASPVWQEVGPGRRARMMTVDGLLIHQVVKGASLSTIVNIALIAAMQPVPLLQYSEFYGHEWLWNSLITYGGRRGA